MSKTLHVGFGNTVMADKIIGIFVFGTHPIKNLVKTARNSNMVVNLTKDKKTKSIILMENDYVVLSALSAATLSKRLDNVMGFEKEESKSEVK